MATAYEGAFPYGLATTVNGGPGKCPALQGAHSRVGDRGRVPSMGDRANARPHGSRPFGPRYPRRSFNGGPGNCPAEPRSTSMPRALTPATPDELLITRELRSELARGRVTPEPSPKGAKGRNRSGWSASRPAGAALSIVPSTGPRLHLRWNGC